MGISIAGILYITSLSLVVVTAFVSSFHVGYHIRHWSQPEFQKYICRIISLPAIYGVFVCAGGLLPATTEVWSVLNDTYEAFVIYSFLQLCINYVGGERRMLLHFEAEGRIPWAAPFDRCLSPLQMDRRTFQYLRFGVLQFVLIRPLSGVIILICALEGVWHQGNMSPNGAFFWIFIVVSTSITIALACLYMFYLIMKEWLQHYSVLPKFLVIKAIIFVPWFQYMIVLAINAFNPVKWSLSGKSLYDSLVLYNAVIICGECLLVAFCFIWIYPVDPLWNPDEGNHPEITPIRSIFVPTEIVDDINAAVEPETVDFRLSARLVDGKRPAEPE